MTYKEQFPLIWEITLSMAQSAGMINREEPDAEAHIEQKMNEALGAEGVDLVDLQTLHAWLLTLTQEQRDLLADGEHDERYRFVMDHSPRNGSEYSLAFIFDDIWENL